MGNISQKIQTYLPLRAAPGDSQQFKVPQLCRAGTAGQPETFPCPQPHTHSAARINQQQQTQNKNKATPPPQTNKSENTFISRSLILDGSLRCLLVSQMTGLCNCWRFLCCSGLLLTGCSWRAPGSPKAREDASFPPHSDPFPVTRGSWGHPAGDDIPLAPVPSHTELSCN